MGSGTYIKRAIKKHGIENFTKTVDEVFETAEDASLRESIVVDESWVLREDTYNLRTGGYVNFTESEVILQAKRERSFGVNLKPINFEVKYADGSTEVIECMASFLRRYDSTYGMVRRRINKGVIRSVRGHNPFEGMSIIRWNDGEDKPNHKPLNLIIRSKKPSRKIGSYLGSLTPVKKIYEVLCTQTVK
jgi:hypothetical protein